MIGVIAEELGVLVRNLQRLLESVDRGGRYVLVLVGEVALKRNLDVRGFDGLLGRKSVKRNRRGQLRDFCGPDYRDRPAHAKSGDSDLSPIAFEILDCPTYGLLGRVEEVQRHHLFRGALRVVIRHDNAVEEVGRQRVKTGKRETIDQSLDLFGQPPPLLYDD